MLGNTVSAVCGLLCMVPVVHGAIDADLITDLPGLTWRPTFKQYSGYLQATGTRKLHYWFVQAAYDPQSKPLVLWLNGGPGASSLLGLLTENGPFRVAADGQTLLRNRYSWNRVANMLYLEAPAGVGYSYSQDKNYTTDDDQVSLDNYMAMRDFIKHYPEFADNAFYITGESYGGIYVPTLSSRVVDDDDFNFNGFAVGNGISDYAMNRNSLMYFMYYHGLIGSELWARLVKYCCKDGCTNMEKCDFAKSKDALCQKAVMETIEAREGLNIYNYLAECYQAPDTLDNVLNSYQLYHYRNNPLVREKLQKLLESPNIQKSPACLDERAPTAYMNDPKVKKVLHIPDMLPTWSTEVKLPYTLIYTSVQQQYLTVLATKKHRILVYNGDVDLNCNYLSDEWFTDSLAQPVESARQPWHYTAEDGSRQVAGYVKSFQNMVFVTIKGAGHMVPTDKPIQALDLFTNFIQNKAFV